MPSVSNTSASSQQAQCFQPVQMPNFRLYRLAPSPTQLGPAKSLLRHNSALHQPHCTSIMGSHSIYCTQVQRVFLAWLLMSPGRRQGPALKFKFNSWAQMVSFQALLAEYFGIDKSEIRPYSAKLRKKRRSVIIQHVKPCDPAQHSLPVPIVKRPESRKEESFTEKQIKVIAGLNLSRAQVLHAPFVRLNQARQHLLLNQALRPREREGIRLSVLNEHCSLLPDRPRWMQRPFESVWPGKCRIRAGAEPPGYNGPLWSKKEWLDGKKKAFDAVSLPRNILKRKFGRRLERVSKRHRAF